MKRNHSPTTVSVPGAHDCFAAALAEVAAIAGSISTMNLRAMCTAHGLTGRRDLAVAAPSGPSQPLLRGVTTRSESSSEIISQSSWRPLHVGPIRNHPFSITFRTGFAFKLAEPGPIATMRAGSIAR